LPKKLKEIQMMSRSSRASILSVLALSLSMAEFTLGAHASTYSCTAVDNKAVLGAKDSDSVSITTGKKTCSFSVNGASVDQKGVPPDFMNAINAFLGGQLDSLSQNSSAAGSLTFLLLGPNGSQSDRTQIEEALRPSLQDISKCISSARYYSDTISFTSGPSSVENDRLTCKFISPSEKPPSKSFGPVEVTATDAVLRLGVKVGDQTHLIFLPSQLIQRGKAGFRFR
jgi:hypothetical protein